MSCRRRTVTAELRTALDQVAHSGRAETCQKTSGTVAFNDRPRHAHHGLLAARWLELQARLHDINRRERAVRDSRAQATGSQELTIVE